MAENSKIEWTDHTFNPWTGCTKVSPGCDHCYAEGWAKRSGTVRWGAGEPRRRTTEANWRQPVKWNRLSENWVANGGKRARVFCSSLADVFDNEVQPEWRADLFELIDKTPHLDWLLLTKRIGNASAMLEEVSTTLALRETGAPWPPRPNVWIGATVVSQAEADRDIPKLLQVPARVRFLSIEPMLGPIDLQRWLWECCGNMHPGNNHGLLGQEPDYCCGNPDPRDALHWVICGGESGPGARPMHPDWARSLRDQCSAAGVPFLMKQWGEWLGQHQDGNPDHQPMELNATDHPIKVGKKAAGRLLDGQQHDGAPA